MTVRNRRAALIGLTRASWENPSRPAQVKAFARRASIALPDSPEEPFHGLLYAFQLPVLHDIRDGKIQEKTSLPGGPWA